MSLRMCALMSHTQEQPSAKKGHFRDTVRLGVIAITIGTRENQPPRSWPSTVFTFIDSCKKSEVVDTTGHLDALALTVGADRAGRQRVSLVRCASHLAFFRQMKPGSSGKSACRAIRLESLSHCSFSVLPE
jgi:hypothetical protein